MSMNPMRQVLLWGSENRWLRDRVPRLGFARRAVRRFMPGEDVDAALTAADGFAADGLATVLTQLGENITATEEAAAVRAHYLDVLDRIARRGIDCTVSVKPTQLGLDLDPGLCKENVRAIVARAEEHGCIAWIDMEASGYVDATLELYRAARARSKHVGVCLQAYLHRTADDLASLLEVGPAIRLVKGAYAEPRSVAMASKRDVDESYYRLARRMLEAKAEGREVTIGIATHDLRLVRRIAAAAAELGLPKGAFEVQMLYGIRADVQRRLAAEGYRVRVLISYGSAWYPWYMRRLAERPANVLFVLRSLLPA
jgi:proline dehydrogenase